MHLATAADLPPHGGAWLVCARRPASSPSLFVTRASSCELSYRNGERHKYCNAGRCAHGSPPSVQLGPPSENITSQRALSADSSQPLIPPLPSLLHGCGPPVQSVCIRDQKPPVASQPPAGGEWVRTTRLPGAISHGPASASTPSPFSPTTPFKRRAHIVASPSRARALAVSVLAVTGAVAWTRHSSGKTSTFVFPSGPPGPFGATSGSLHSAQSRGGGRAPPVWLSESGVRTLVLFNSVPCSPHSASALVLALETQIGTCFVLQTSQLAHSGVTSTPRLVVFVFGHVCCARRPDGQAKAVWPAEETRARELVTHARSTASRHPSLDADGLTLKTLAQPPPQTARCPQSLPPAEPVDRLCYVARCTE